MKIDKEIGTKLWFFSKEITEYFYSEDDGTIANKLISAHPELELSYVKETANKGAFLKKIKELINVNLEELIGVDIKLVPRLSFDVSECVINAMDKKEKTFFIYLFAENIDEKIALETASEFNNIGMESKIYIVLRNRLFGLSDTLDLFLNDYASYLSKMSKIDNVLKINPSKLVFALGAGCSIDANIGNWQQLNDALSFELLSSEDNYGLTNYGIKDVNENILLALSTDFDKNSLIDIAIRKKKNEEEKTSEFFKYVHDILYMNYDESKLDYKTDILISISNCVKRIKMNKLITYNFDSALEKNIDKDYRSDSDEIRSSKSSVAYGTNNVNIFHVHGYLPYDYDGITKVSNFILSDTDFYLNIFNDIGITNSIQKDLLNNNDVIFIGCSFNDSNIKQILLSLDEKRDNRIYAILKTPSFDKLISEKKRKEAEISILKYKMLLNNYLRYYGVKVIWVNEFTDIPIILNQINNSDVDIEINIDEITNNI